MEDKFVRGLVTVENARLIYRNFAGRAGDYNPEGSRNFSVFIDEKTAAQLKQDDWNVRYLKQREQDDPLQAILKVNVSYAKQPPEVYVVVGDKIRPIGEGEIGMLDVVEIVTADLKISPYNYLRNRKHGVSGYLRTLYVTILLDDLQQKYAPMMAGSASDDQPPRNP